MLSFSGLITQPECYILLHGLLTLMAYGLTAPGRMGDGRWPWFTCLTVLNPLLSRVALESMLVLMLNALVQCSLQRLLPTGLILYLRLSVTVLSDL